MLFYQEMEPVIAIGAVVLRGDEVLLVKRKNPPLAGEWTLVGGRPREGEPLADATAREVYEETGLVVDVIAPLAVVTIRREGYAYAIHEHLCLPRDPSAVPRPGDDALEARWAARGDLPHLGVRPEAIAVVDEAFRTSRPPA
jgi:ADP-ribose pyrophosphatase YjhB (NUDIX family)